MGMLAPDRSVNVAPAADAIVARTVVAAAARTAAARPCIQTGRRPAELVEAAGGTCMVADFVVDFVVDMLTSGVERMPLPSRSQPTDRQCRQSSPLQRCAPRSCAMRTDVRGQIQPLSAAILIAWMRFLAPSLSVADAR